MSALRGAFFFKDVLFVALIAKRKWPESFIYTYVEDEAVYLPYITSEDRMQSGKEHRPEDGMGGCMLPTASGYGRVQLPKRPGRTSMHLAPSSL